jgi:hypothetical protein
MPAHPVVHLRAVYSPLLSRSTRPAGKVAAIIFLLYPTKLCFLRTGSLNSSNTPIPPSTLSSNRHPHLPCGHPDSTLQGVVPAGSTCPVAAVRTVPEAAHIDLAAVRIGLEGDRSRGLVRMGSVMRRSGRMSRCCCSRVAVAVVARRVLHGRHRGGLVADFAGRREVRLRVRSVVLC